MTNKKTNNKVIKMIKTSLKMILPLFLILVIIGSISANVVNYTEINETVEHNTIIDEKPIINSSQELINVENKTYDEISVKNETVSNTTYEEHTQKIIDNKTEYTHGGENYKGSEIDYIVLENDSIIKYDDNKNLAGCEPKPLNKYCNATLYLKNGTVLDIVIHNEGNKAYQNYGYRQVVPVYEDEVIVFENITNKITTFVNHITKVLYQVIDNSQPIPPILINNITDTNTTDTNITEINTTDTNITEINTTDVNTTEINITDVNITDVNITNVNITNVNNIEIVINNIIDEPNVVVADNNIEIDDVEIGNLVDVVKMENTGGFISVLVLAILLIILAFIVIVLRD